MGIATDLLIIGGGVVTAGSLVLASYTANTAVPPPSPDEDEEFPSTTVDLTPYYLAGFAGAVMLGAGVMLKIRGKPQLRIPGIA